ncbi:hypothetical protein A2Y99_04520 [Candidatus Gottesmanbacteria bacterium RBG_13_37_7]|uniref:SAM-dependent MTase RsmB/NOP-type domain-containing protein n=1 Tax=Candidatus Gottesmanbacteria bacterium RBG_13_37_7 TaxID=1798369 RepID=A0A1F5YGA8_9BACT|nr:MAG: hypothetical protein A2Y99_04520 [Candidatus Gottesmanbacteria bacterium RBG_13_37_7]
MKTWKNLSSEFLERLGHIVPANKLAQVLHVFSIKRPTTIRVNTLKISVWELRRMLLEQRIKLDPVPWYKNAFIVNNISLRELQESDLYRNGYFYVQSLSSMIPALILDPKPGEKILDITAAPGSKTTQMSATMGNDGEIIANDTSPLRLLRLEANIKTQGVNIVKIKKTDARNIWRDYPEYFNRTLVDVPCSMEGRMSLSEPKSYSGWSLKKIQNLAKLQCWILRSAVSATKVGGRIVYSTCTLAPEENEGVIDWILSKEEGNIVLEDIFIKNLEFSLAKISWNGKSYSSEIRKCRRVLPSNTMEGFFIASLRKIRSNIGINKQLLDT